MNTTPLRYKFTVIQYAEFSLNAFWKDSEAPFTFSNDRHNKTMVHLDWCVPDVQ